VGFSYQQFETAELAELITAAQADDHDDSPAMNEIIRRFDAKARQIAGAVCLHASHHDDVANAARLAMVRAVRRHQAVRGGFTAYAIKFMTGAARRESRRLAHPQELCYPGPDLGLIADRTSVMRVMADGSVADQGGWGAGRVAKIIASLPARQQALLSERYVHDMDLVRIARLHGSSVSAVSQRLATAHRHVRAMLLSSPPGITVWPGKVAQHEQP
jgi:RNA polymerase sigma factor (sigma-70 family)